MNKITMVYPYYKNPGMLRLQLNNWETYSGGVRENTQIIIVDDGTPEGEGEALPIIKEYIEDNRAKVKISLFRVDENIPWNQHGARNIGAKVAPKGWLYMSDMDNILTADNMLKLQEKRLKTSRYYTVTRKSMTDDNGLEPMHYHCNTFLVDRDVYWEVGGYDEDYCGTYGGDGPFLRQLNVIAPREHLADVQIIRYSREVQPDASTVDWDRKGEMKAAYRAIFDSKRKSGNERSKNPLRAQFYQQIHKNEVAV